MKKLSIQYTIILVAAISGLLLYVQHEKGMHMDMIPHITWPGQLSSIFPQDTQKLASETTNIIDKAQREIDAIINRSDDQLTFDNTIQAFDQLTGALYSWGASLHVLHMASSDAAIRDAAYQQMLKLEEFAIEKIEYNYYLYKKLETCGNALLQDDIQPHRARYITDLLDAYKKRGFALSEEDRQEAMQLSKQLVQQSMQFDANINQDSSSITATRDQLAGLDDSFISSLEQADDGQYKLGADYPTYSRVMENCRVADTRYRMWHMFSNRAYPENKPLLEQIISLRDQFAKKVGYQDYAHLDIDHEEMAENPETVQGFLQELLERTQQKWEQEFANFTQNLPESVTLDDHGRLKPWDISFVKNQYKKSYHAVDEAALTHYFPLEHTLNQLLSIYEQFFGIQFKTVPVDGLWSDDLWCVQAYYNGELMGHIIMDLFPRDNKYSHAAHVGVVPSVIEGDKRHPSVIFLVANFPKPQGDEPALLKRDDVMTFFHEFGHCLHTLFGATELIGQSGTHVATDFVELPSQMLEEWLYDKDILKKVSSHYTTGDPLPDADIERIQGLQEYDAGFFVQRQVALSRMSLYSFMDGSDKDADQLFNLAFSHMHPYIMPSDENHFYTAFGHLTGYGSKYYSYLWSKVYAIDVYSYIRERGLLDQSVGKRYAHNVLMPGDTKKPITLLQDFLERTPSRDAFYNYYHFNGQRL